MSRYDKLERCKKKRNENEYVEEQGKHLKAELIAIPRIRISPKCLPPTTSLGITPLLYEHGTAYVLQQTSVPLQEQTPEQTNSVLTEKPTPSSYKKSHTFPIFSGANPIQGRKISF